MLDWDARYRQQAAWTRPLRQYLYERLGLEQARGVLDLGCGTGALLPELVAASSGPVHGLDIDPAALIQARQSAPQALLALGDAHHLPYPDHHFDLTVCHFVLLWLSDPARALDELVRVTHPGGFVVALAEPDYGGRIDHPDELARLGELQAEALQRQGADPRLGRRLPGLFRRAGLREVESGILGAQWSGPGQDDPGLEWDVLRQDLGPLPGLDDLEQIDRQARADGQRVLYVPTFYAFGRANV
jgi:SAM-dependent methyltransferase